MTCLVSKPPIEWATTSISLAPVAIKVRSTAFESCLARWSILPNGGQRLTIAIGPRPRVVSRRRKIKNDAQFMK